MLDAENGQDPCDLAVVDEQPVVSDTDLEDIDVHERLKIPLRIDADIFFDLAHDSVCDVSW